VAQLELNRADFQLPENWEDYSPIDTYEVKSTPLLASLSEFNIEAIYARGANLAEVDPYSLYGIIGSREVSEAEYMMAYQLAYLMGKLGKIDTSGFAEQIDTAGHIGAINANLDNLPTVATLGVLSGPINKLYMPPRSDYKSEAQYQEAIANRQFRARTITKLAGALLTEHPYTEKDFRWDHLGRNRITARLAITPSKQRPLVAIGGSTLRGGTLNTVNTTINLGGRVLLVAAPNQVYSPTDLVGYYRAHKHPQVMITENVQEAVDTLTGGKEG
jgi:predicted Rossmann fold nucleotide-binding protein DprA/Smf involved in DNA uptake